MTLNWAGLVPAPRRPALGLAYALLLASGVASLLWPLPSVELASTGWQWWVWISFYIFGTAFALTGVITDLWFGELIGIPLAITVFAIFGVSSFALGGLTAVASGMFLLAVALTLYVRWMQLWDVRRLAEITRAQSATPQKEDR